MARGITIERSVEAVEPIPGRGDGFRIQITAKDAEGMPKEVFLFLQTVLNTKTGLTGRMFCAVTSPEDLVSVPVGVPNLIDSPPFFRDFIIDVIVASRAVAESMFDAIKERVCELVVALDRKDRLQLVDSTRCGDPVTPETSESVSESISESVSA